MARGNGENMTTEFRVIVDRESTNPAMSRNGGDYDFGRTIVVEDGKPVAVRYWTSADFDYCPHRGTFDRCEERFCETPEPMHPSHIEGWEDAPVLEGDDARRAAWRWETDPTRFYLLLGPVLPVIVAGDERGPCAEYAPDEP